MFNGNGNLVTDLLGTDQCDLEGSQSFLAEATLPCEVKRNQMTLT